MWIFACGTYLQSYGAGLSGGVGREVELDSRVRGGHQKGSSWCERTTVLHWTGNHHKPRELVHRTARQLQVEQVKHFNINVPICTTRKKQVDFYNIFV